MAGTTSLSFSGITLAAGGSCTVTFDVTSSAPGTHPNQTLGVTTAQTPTAGSPSNVASLTVVAAPTIAKSFSPTAIAAGGVSQLRLDFTNPSGNPALTSVAVTDDLPAGMTVAATPGLSNTCDGSVTGATSGSTAVGLSGGALGAGPSSCQVHLNVTSSTAGVANNTTGTVSAIGGGITVTGSAAGALLTVVAPPTIAKAFGAGSVVAGGTATTLTFTLANPNAATALTGVGFTDALPAGLVVATPNGLSTTCGGTVSATAGSTSISLSTATLAAGASCQIIVNVAGTSSGAKNNLTTAVTSGEGGAGNTASANLTVIDPTAPTIAKAFGIGTIGLGETTTLTFTLSNLNGAAALTGVGFTDALPAGLLVAAPNGLTGSCGGGTITATAASSSVSLGGATLAGGAACVFGVTVTATTTGAKTNTTGAVTSSNGGTGNTATAALTVAAPDLTLTKAAAGSFAKGQTGTYTLTVTNVGAGPTAGPVTVTDTLPAGLTASAISGPGWICTLTSVSCTRSDALAAGGSYAPITLTVSIAATAPNSLVNAATVSGGGDTSPSNNAATASTALGAVSIPTLSTSAQALAILLIVLSGLVVLRRRATTG